MYQSTWFLKLTRHDEAFGECDISYVPIRRMYYDEKYRFHYRP